MCFKGRIFLQPAVVTADVGSYYEGEVLVFLFLSVLFLFRSKKARAHMLDVGTPQTAPAEGTQQQGEKGMRG